MLLISTIFVINDVFVEKIEENNFLLVIKWL